MRRKKLIDDTLLKLDGEVIVTFLLNGVQHIVKRNSKTQEISLESVAASSRRLPNIRYVISSRCRLTAKAIEQSRRAH